MQNNTPIAVLVETRAHSKLIPIVENFVSHLPLNWRLQLFLSDEGILLVQSKENLNASIQAGRLLLCASPINITSGFNLTAYNALLQSERFWLSVQGDPVLIFQTDSVLCHNSSRHITEFMQYDYVGAPWHSAFPWTKSLNGLCGNGGLSLRSKSMTLKAIRTVPTNHAQNEDLWFCAAFLAMGAKFPPRHIAREFAVETVFYAQPLGVHTWCNHRVPAPFDALEGANKSDKAIFYKNCPEALLLQ